MIRFAVLSIDPAIGRLDYDSLSDQALMEMLVTDMDPIEIETYQDDNGNFKDVCEWVGVKCSDSRVTDVDLSNGHYPEVQFRFEFVPPLVVRFRAQRIHMCGTIDTSVLPLQLEILDVPENILGGTLSFKAFPRSLKEIYLFENCFIGSCVLEDLPEGLTVFCASRNGFSGELAFVSVPPKMTELYLDDNELTGSIMISCLSKSMMNIDLSDNAFSGDFCMLSFPESLRLIDVSCFQKQLAPCTSV